LHPVFSIIIERCKKGREREGKGTTSKGKKGPSEKKGMKKNLNEKEKKGNMNDKEGKRKREQW